MEVGDLMASKIRGKRSELGISQEELAAKLMVNVTTICSWEQGRTTPSAPYIVQLSELFNVTPNYLFGL